MELSRRQMMSLVAASAVTAGMAGKVVAAENKTVVTVDLWDDTGALMDAFDPDMPILMATAGAAFKDSAPMGVTPDQYLVPAGEVEFQVTNSSKDLEHEMIVVPIADPDIPLPYNPNTGRFDEDAAGAIGEVPETEPGASGSLVLHLDPGVYMLACNIATHYAMGMWTLIRVA